MRAIYKKLDQLKFKRLSLFGLILADLLSFNIFYQRITSKEMLSFMALILSKNPALRGQTVPPRILEELSPLINSFTLMLLGLVFLYHCIVYYLYYFKKLKAALNYIQFYACTAVIGSFLFAYSLISQGKLNALLIIIATLGFSFFAFAPSELKKIKTEG